MADHPKFKGYKIESEVGRGAVGVIYQAIQEKLNRKVAIKVMEEPTLQKDEEIFGRFLREAETAAGLYHSNIIRIVDTGKVNKYYYIVMEYLEESLRDRMDGVPEGKIPPGIALEIVKGIMGALDYAHLQGIYHRDIKPENIMFRRDNTPVLVDFGIAKIFDKHITKTGTIIGTTYYMSPEQCKAGEIDGRTDIYSLGVVLFEMLTGKKPYEGDSDISLALMHIEGPVPKLPQELSQYQPLIDKMMAKDKKERIFSRPELDELLKTIGIVPRISTPPGKEKFPLTGPVQTAQKPIKLFPLREEEPSFLQKVTGSLKSSIEKFLDLFTGKVLPRMNKPIVKKLVLVFFPAAVIFAVILIIIFSQGNQSSTNQAAQSGITLPFFGDIYKQAPKYYEKLNHVHQLYSVGDLKSLNDAEGLINELKKTAIIPELEELEEKITKRIKLLNKLSKKYFEVALEYYTNDDFPKAMEYVLKAKTISPTDKDILRLEELIEKQLKDKNRKEIPTTE